MSFFIDAVKARAKFQQVVLNKASRCRICEKTIKSGKKHPALLTPKGKCLARYCSENCRQEGELHKFEVGPLPSQLRI